jgi:hypothetical protein
VKNKHVKWKEKTTKFIQGQVQIQFGWFLPKRGTDEGVAFCECGGWGDKLFHSGIGLCNCAVVGKKMP